MHERLPHGPAYLDIDWYLDTYFSVSTPCMLGRDGKKVLDINHNYQAKRCLRYRLNANSISRLLCFI